MDPNNPNKNDLNYVYQYNLNYLVLFSMKALGVGWFFWKKTMMDDVKWMSGGVGE